MLLSVITVLILLVISALFSGAEISILTASQARINKLKNDGNKKAEVLLKLREDKEKLIGSVLLSNNFVNIGASVIATEACIDIFGDNSTALFIVTAIMTIAVLIISDVLPKTYAVRHSESMALSLTPFIAFTTLILTPIVVTVKYIVNTLLRLVDKKNPATTISALEAIKSTIELHHQEGEVVSDYKYMLGGVIDLEKITVEEVMVHRNEFISINIDLTPMEIIKQIVKSPYSRIPIWKDKPENIIGVLHMKDLNKLLLPKKSLDKITHLDIEKLAREPWFIPSTTNLKTQMLAFRTNHYPFAFVVNEYGELEGLVTLEDIIEEVVGQIEDEYDVIHKGIHKVNSDSSVITTGNTPIRDVNRELEWNIDDKEATTVGGLIFHLAQRIPEKGESFKSGNYTLKLLKKKKNKILKVKIAKNGFANLEDKKH
jgi:Mg2+/Co2+ transporter CorB